MHIMKYFKDQIHVPVTYTHVGIEFWEEMRISHPLSIYLRTDDINVVMKNNRFKNLIHVLI